MLIVTLPNFLELFLETWGRADTVIGLVLSIALMFVMYVLVSINRKLRLIENELQGLRKDQSVMSDELEIVASSRAQSNH
jgi:hypothetical protein